MTAKDQLKITDAGITIIRADLIELRIKIKDCFYPEWHTFEKNFKSKTALQRRMKEMLNNDTIIED